MTSPLPDLVFRVGRPTEELRYAIRSQVQHVQHRNVWTAGAPVPWSTAPHIDVPHQPGQGKYDHAYAVLRAILTHPDLTPAVIISDDDMYALQPIPHPYPAYTRGRLGDITSRANGQGLADTKRILGPNHPCHDLHVPTLVNRAQLAHRLDTTRLPRQRKAHLMWRTIAGGTNPVPQGDAKIRRPDEPWPTGPWLSTSDTAYPGAADALHARFPTPSPYETTGDPA